MESVRVTREPYPCGHNHAESLLYEIGWTEPEGQREAKSVAYCDHPICEAGPWRLAGYPPLLIETAWVPIMRGNRAAVATVYILVVEAPFGDRLPEIVARIGICAQWRDPQHGNVDPTGNWIDLQQRYWALEGPGVYPVPIEDVPMRELGVVYGNQLDAVLDAWEEAQRG